MRTLLVSAALLFVQLPAGVAQGGGPLTLDRIVSSAKPVAGTSPIAPQWSPDSRWIAFLWNDTAGPGRDLWVAERAGGVPRRVTSGGAGEFVWGRDSRQLIVLRAGDLWRVDPAGGTATQLTRTGGDKSDLALSPDGLTVSYLADGDLWLHQPATGTTTQATHLAVAPPTDVRLGTYFRPDVEVGRYVWGGGRAYAWSPDGRYIAVQVVDRRAVRLMPFPYYLGDESSLRVLRRGTPGDVNERRTLRLLDVAGGTLRPLELAETESRQILDFEWSPTGALLIDRESDTAEDRWLLVADPATGRIEVRWHDHRPTRVYNAVAATWGADGREILFVSDLDDWYRLYSLAPGAQTPTALTAPGFDVTGDRGALAPIVDRRSIWYVSTAAGPAERQVYRIGATGGTPTRITTRPGTHTPFLSPDGQTLAVLHSDDLTPTELYLIDARQGSERRVTTSPPPEFATAGFAKPRYVSFPHQSEPFTLHAKILEPPGFDPAKRYPVVFGPVYSNTVRNRWGGQYGLVQQLMAQRGYLVVQVDVRGSTGYGRDFRERFLMDWGGGDLDDLESAVRYLRTVPYADTDRMGIWGSSYGGTLTVFMLFKKPGLFKAGVAGAPATDPRFFGSDDVAIARRPATHPEAFTRGDARQYAANLRDHLLIIHGMQDDVVPFKTSVVLAEHLMRLGKDFDFAFAPGATHGWTQREHYARYLLGKLVGHFDRYLGGGPR
jgi:dipeptidyl-peptidase-4